MSKVFTYPAKRMSKLRAAYSNTYLADFVSVEQIVYSTPDQWRELRHRLVRTKHAPENPLTREEFKPISQERKLVTMWQKQPRSWKKGKARKTSGRNDGGAAATMSSTTTSEEAAIRVAFEAIGNAVQSEGSVGEQGGNVLPELNLSDQNDGGDVQLDGSCLDADPYKLDLGMDAWAGAMLQTNRCDNEIRDALDADFLALDLIAMDESIVDDPANIQDQEEQCVPSLAVPLAARKRDAPDDDGTVVQKTKRSRPLVRVPTRPEAQWPVTSAPVRTARTLACVPSVLGLGTKKNPNPEWTKLCKDPLNSR